MNVIAARKIGASTLKLQKSRINTIKRLYKFADFDEPQIKDVLANPIEFEAKLNKADLVPSTAVMFHDLMMQLAEHYKTNVDAWKMVRNKYAKMVRDDYDSNEPSEKQRAAFVEWPEVLRIRETLPDKDKLLLSMYTAIPPARVDYYAVELLDEEPKNPDKGNYIVVPDSLLVLNDYKTAKSLGQLRTDLPEYIMQQIPAEQKYLFEGKKGQPYKKRSYNQWANARLRHIFGGKPVSLTSLRHWYATSEKGGTLADLKRNARAMGHSLETHLEYVKNY
jgi:integrase